jgi:hypothetical protein
VLGRVCSEATAGRSTLHLESFASDVSMAILGIDFLRAHNLMADPGNCRLVQAGGRIYPTLAVRSGPTASVITGASSPNSRPASAAADVKLPSGLSAAA